MVVALQKLQRVFSRNKMEHTTSIQQNQTFNEKHDYSQPDSIDLHTNHSNDTDEVQYDTVDAQKSLKKESPTLSYRRLVTGQPRKDSYASVKEESDFAQAFTTRSPLYQINPCEGVELFRTKSLAAREGNSYYSNSEEAITDDDDEASSLHSTRKPAVFETLPDEILDIIFSLVTLDPSKDRFVNPRVDLFSLLFVSKTIHSAALKTLYQHAKFTQSKAFGKFTDSLRADSQLGGLVKCLDFSHYNPTGYGKSFNERMGGQYLTTKSLGACLETTTALRAFLVHGRLDDELDDSIMSRVLTQQSMRALDLCACSSDTFTSTLTRVSTKLASNATTLTIQRLSLHCCATLPGTVFEALLPLMPRLTHLDVAYTKITDEALMLIPHTAKITHLNLSRCNQLSESGVIHFLSTHPAVNCSLVYLNLMADPSRYRLLSESGVTELLPILPSSLRSLNIGGSRIDGSNVPALQRLATSLEELGLRGADLSLNTDISSILSMPKTQIGKTPMQSNLRYIDLANIKSVNKVSLLYSPDAIVETASLPLEAIELSEGVLAEITRSIKSQKQPEWKVSELKRRGWLVRQTNFLPPHLSTADDGWRPWKMGSRGWGMRKIPVWEQETGGMYGHYMFAY